MFFSGPIRHACATLSLAATLAACGQASAPGEAIAVEKVVNNFCLPSIITGSSLFDYATNADLDPIEKSYLRLNDGGVAKYAWIYKFDGGQLLLSEEVQDGQVCQIFMRKGDSKAVQAHVEAILTCESCYFQRDDDWSRESRDMRIDKYSWSNDKRVISITTVSRNKRAAQTAPAFSIMISGASIGAGHGAETSF